MKLGTRTVATLAVSTFLLVPAVFADETGAPKSNASVNSTVTDGGSARPKAPGRKRSPERTSSADSGEGRGGPSPSGGDPRQEHRNTTPKVELFLGYSYWKGVPDSTKNRLDEMHGGSTSLAYNFNSHIGLVFDFAGFRVDSLELNSPGAGFSPSRTANTGGNVFSLLFGPRVSFRNHERLTPFLQVLGGGVRASQINIEGCTALAFACTPLSEETVFALTAGGGLDLRMTHRIALRLFQAEYLGARFRDPSSLSGDHGWQNNVRLSAGIVFGFGGNPPPPPNRSPVVSCSVDRSMVYAASGDAAAVHAVASDPDNDPLTYSWTTSGGTVEGNGADARWSDSNAAPGAYAVKVRVDDGRGGTAECSTDIRVEPRPNRPPTMTCSADHDSVLIGEPVQIVATASDPDNDPLSYSWDSSAGLSLGPDATARFDTTSLKAGHYSVTGHVTDGRGGAADCRLEIEVRQPPPPPEMVELEARLSLHSVYFPTARPSERNRTGGLVPSQEKILASLAEDFQRYLKFKPDAHLILGGHADERGSAEYNKALTERRVERTKSFLVEHGVSVVAIETRSFGQEDELNAEQVKAQIAENPDLTPDDRKQMLRNLPVMVLANNRRVDVTLSTTGQQSTRRYPFNAKDFLTLINTKNGDSAARPTTKKRPKQ